MNSPTPLKFAVAFALLTYAAFMAATVRQGAKLRAETSSIDLPSSELQEQIEDIRYQLAEEQLETDSLILSDIVQSHLRGMKHPHNSLQCLTNNIYYEAGIEPFAGKVAVAQVTMNRVADDFGGDTVCNVVYFRKISPEDGKIQAAFSWTLGRHWRAHGRINRIVWLQCEDIARKVLAGKLRSNIIGPNVEYYHATYIHARWDSDHREVAQIGHHVFYQ